MAPPKVLLGAMARAQSYFTERVIPGWKELACSLPSNFTPDIVKTYLLASIFFSLRDFVDAVGQGGNYFRIHPIALKANTPTRVLEKDVNGRVRLIRIWVDSLVGLPDAVIRVGTKNSSVTSGGVRLTAGIANELGKVPDNTELWMSTDVNVTVYVVEEA